MCDIAKGIANVPAPITAIVRIQYSLCQFPNPIRTLKGVRTCVDQIDVTANPGGFPS